MKDIETRLRLLNLFKEMQEEYPALKSWTFKINKNKCRFGVCRRDEKSVEVAEFVLQDPDEAEETLRHEIAHALAPNARNPHGRAWKNMAARLGANPRACATIRLEAPAKYTGFCSPDCEWHGKHQRHRIANQRMNSYQCRFCKAGIEWTENENA